MRSRDAQIITSVQYFPHCFDMALYLVMQVHLFRVTGTQFAAHTALFFMWNTARKSMLSIGIAESKDTGLEFCVRRELLIHDRDGGAAIAYCGIRKDPDHIIHLSHFFFFFFFLFSKFPLLFAGCMSLPISICRYTGDLPTVLPMRSWSQHSPSSRGYSHMPAGIVAEKVILPKL